MNYKLDFVIEDLYLNIHGIELISQTSQTMLVDIHKTQKYIMNKNILELNSLDYFEVVNLLNTKIAGVLEFTPLNLTAQYFIAIKCETEIECIDLSQVKFQENTYYVNAQYNEYAFTLATILYSLAVNKQEFKLYTLPGYKFTITQKTISYSDLLEHAETYCGDEFNELKFMFILNKFGYSFTDNLVYFPVHRLINDLDDVFGDYVGYVQWGSFEVSETLFGINSSTPDLIYNEVNRIKRLGYKFIKLNYLTSYKLYAHFNQIILPTLRPINPTSDERDLFNNANKFLEILQYSQKLQNSSLPLKVYSLYETELHYELITLTLIKQQNPCELIKTLIKTPTIQITNPLFQIIVEHNNVICGIVLQDVQDYFKYRSESTIILSLKKILKS